MMLNIFKRRDAETQRDIFHAQQDFPVKLLEVKKVNMEVCLNRPRPLKGSASGLVNELSCPPLGLRLKHKSY